MFYVCISHSTSPYEAGPGLIWLEFHEKACRWPTKPGAHDCLRPVFHLWFFLKFFSCSLFAVTYTHPIQRTVDVGMSNSYWLSRRIASAPKVSMLAFLGLMSSEFVVVCSAIFSVFILLVIVANYSSVQEKQA